MKKSKHTLACGQLADGREYKFHYRPAEAAIEWSLGKYSEKMPELQFLDLATSFQSAATWIMHHKVREAAIAEQELRQMGDLP